MLYFIIDVYWYIHNNFIIFLALSHLFTALKYMLAWGWLQVTVFINISLPAKEFAQNVIIFEMIDNVCVQEHANVTQLLFWSRYSLIIFISRY